MYKRIVSALMAFMLLALLPADALAASFFDPPPEPERTDGPGDAVPEFVPGYLPEDDGLEYPDYDLLAGLFEDDPPFDAEESDGSEDAIPEFVPGYLPEDDGLEYPDYGLLVDLFEDGLPSYYDTRSISQTSVKNQGSNGLCWTFATYAAMEANMWKKGMGEHDFSELHMGYSTSNWSGNTVQGFDRSPGDGGNRFKAASYLMRGTDLSGAVDEASDPYITRELTESDARDLPITQSKEKIYQAQNIIFLTGEDKDNSAVNAIKRAVQTYGGVGASIYWQGQTTATDGSQQAFFNKEHGAYCYSWYKDSNSDRPKEMNSSNHGVEIVGWDDGYPRENFNEISRPQSNGAWLIKNSWGENWGDGGYAWVSYEDTNFPLRTYCFDRVKAHDNSEIVYETDYLNNGGTSGWKDSTEQYLAKVFGKETDGTENLKSVRVYVGTPYLEMQVGYASGEAFSTGSLSYTFRAEGTTGSNPGRTVFAPGWYTINFPDSCSITGQKGSQFAVAVKIVAPSADEGGKGVYLGTDTTNPLGASKMYYSSRGSSWSESSNNYCIKAVTKPADTRDQGQVVTDKAAQRLSWEVIRGGNGLQTSVRTDLNLPTTFKGASVDWTSTALDVIASNGKVTRPVAYNSAAVTLTATFKASGVEKAVPFYLTVPNILPEDRDAVQTVAGQINWGAINGENTAQSNVTQDLTLMPSGTQDDGVTVTWESSNTEIINTDGTVTLPRFDKINTVTLTATVARGEAEQVIAFELTVPHRAVTDEDRYLAAKDWLTYARRWDLIKGQNTDSKHIRYDFEVPAEVLIPTEFGTAYSLDVRPRAYAWGDGLWTNYVDNYGKVTRPPYGQPDVSGYFSFYIRSAPGEYGSTPSVLFTVLSYKGVITSASLPNAAPSGTVLRANVSTQGDPGTLLYQWYQADDANKATPRKIAGAASAEFSPSEGGYYYCEVSALDAAPVETNTAAVTFGDIAQVNASDSRTVQLFNVRFPDGTPVFAASYDGSGRMTGVRQGSIRNGTVITFNGGVAPGWRLFFLDDGKHTPLRETMVIS